MTGLFLLAVVAIWLAIAAFLTRILTRKVSRAAWRLPLGVVLFCALAVLPLIDEIVGGQQFSALCESQPNIEPAFAQAKGMTLRRYIKQYVPVSGTVLRVYESTEELADPKNWRTVVVFKFYRSEGGWLIRSLRISETNAPLSFRGSCGPFGKQTLQEVIDRHQIRLTYN